MRISIFSCIAMAWALSGCGSSEDGGPDPEGRGKALVITTDYQDGSYSLIDLEDHGVEATLNLIGSDAVCRYDSVTRTPFIVSRMGTNAVEVLSPEEGWQVVGEYSVGAGSNPQDIAVVTAERAYVPRYNSADLLAVHPITGDELDSLDLSAYADPDGVPELAWTLVLDDQVFVAAQRLTDFMPGDYSSLLVLDAATGRVDREIRLSAVDPFSPIRYVPALDRIAVTEVGAFGALDGGLELLAPDAAGPAGLAVTEADLGGDLVDAVVVDENRGYAVIGVDQGGGEMTTRLVRFDPTTGQPAATLAEADAYDHSFLALSPDRSQLWVTDRHRTEPGVRIYSVEDDRELTDGPIDVGLPPFMVCFVP